MATGRGKGCNQPLISARLVWRYLSFQSSQSKIQKSGTKSQRWTSEPSRQFPFEFPQNYKISQQFPIPSYCVRACNFFTPCWAHEILKRQFPAKWKLKFHGLLSHQCHPRYLIQTNVTIKYSGARNLSISESKSTCAMDYRMHMEVHLTRSKE